MENIWILILATLLFQHKSLKDCSIGSSNGLALNMWQASAWTNEDPKFYNAIYGVSRPFLGAVHAPFDGVDKSWVNSFSNLLASCLVFFQWQ